MEIHDKIVFKHNGVKLEYKPLNVDDRYWLSNFECGKNKAIFDLLGIEDRFAFCEKEIGYSIEYKTADFPEVNSLEDLKKIVDALYKRIIEISTPKFKVGDSVMIAKREGNEGDYPCSYMDRMLSYKNHIFTISEIHKLTIPSLKNNISRLKYEEPFYYTFEGNDWSWTSAMLRKVGVIKDQPDVKILTDTGEIDPRIPSYISPDYISPATSGPSIHPEKEESEYKLIFKFNHLKF